MKMSLFNLAVTLWALTLSDVAASTSNSRQRQGSSFGRNRNSSSSNDTATVVVGVTSTDRINGSNKNSTTSSSGILSRWNRDKSSDDEDISGGDDILYERKRGRRNKEKEEVTKTAAEKPKETQKKKNQARQQDKSEANEDQPQKDKTASEGRGPFGLFKPLKKEEKGDVDVDVDEEDFVPSNVTRSNKKSTNTNTTLEDTETTTGNSTSALAKNAASPRAMAIAPRLIVMGAPGGHPPSGTIPGIYRAPSSPQSLTQANQQAMATAVVGSLVGALSRIWLIVWITKRLASEEETMVPEQHFVWECLNDRYSKDDTVLQNVMANPPLGFSKRKWAKHLKDSRPEPPKKNEDPILPTRSVIVVDITPGGQLDMTYLSDLVNFLVSSHSKTQFGVNPEIVLLVRSPGGPVTLYGLAAAQVGRLRQVGLNVTICVDSVAASGGYMIASQATTLVAAPFAYVGSIGVISEGLNFNKLLTNYGIKPLILKAGNGKNPLSALGPVSQDDIETQTERLVEVHKAFIDLCLSRRPGLDPSICDGTVMVGSQGIQYGMVDRILTSDEYIWERLRDGAHIMKLHKSTQRPSKQMFFARALDLLPHLRERVRNMDTGKLVSFVVQGAAFVSMVRRSLGLP